MSSAVAQGGGAIGGIVSSIRGPFVAKSLQGRAEQASQISQLMRYRWMMRDLEKAGLNPMLALTGGASPGGLGTGIATPQGMGGSMDVIGAAKQVKLFGAQVRKAIEDARTAKADADIRELDAKFDKSTFDDRRWMTGLARGKMFNDAITSVYNAKSAEESWRQIQTKRPRMESHAEFDKTPLGQISAQVGRFLENALGGITVGAGAHYGAGSYRSDSTVRRGPRMRRR